MRKTDYKHYISLGSFCSVALELERIGLRETSAPFDWLITDFEGVIRAIDSHFSEWLEYKNLLQNEKFHCQYKDTYYKCMFFHDFNKYDPLESQIDSVRAKYQRRIDRFYDMIKEPTLFIRYLNDKKLENGKLEELLYIEEKYDYIIEVIKSFNPDNDILFIANEGAESDIINIHSVEKDKDDYVAREFLEKMPTLDRKLRECNYENRNENLKIFKKKKRKERFNKSFIVRIIKSLKEKNKKEYIHDKQYKSLLMVL